MGRSKAESVVTRPKLGGSPSGLGRNLGLGRLSRPRIRGGVWFRVGGACAYGRGQKPNQRAGSNEWRGGRDGTCRKTQDLWLDRIGDRRILGDSG